MDKELIIEALNKAIKVYKSTNHQPLWGDIVTDININDTKIGSYLTRHPGCLMLPVKLMEGSGYFFIRGDTNILGNEAYIAWEEDNTLHSLEELLSEMPHAVIKELSEFLNKFVAIHF